MIKLGKEVPSYGKVKSLNAKSLELIFIKIFV
jgi:hypothetical protein